MAKSPLPEADSIFAGSQGAPVKRAYINNSNTTGDNQVVAGVANKKIRVLGMYLIQQSNAEASVFRADTSATGSTLQLATDGILVWPFSQFGWLEISVGKTLNLNKSSTGVTDLGIIYCEVPV